MQPEVVLEGLAGGLRVVLVPCASESVAIGVYVLSGSRHETEATAGISHFIEHMLFKGTKARRQLEITQAIEGRGGTMNACTSPEYTGYYVHLPSEYRDEALDILADMYLNAQMPADEFVREKAVILEELKMYDDQPDAVVVENLERALFPVHRLGCPVGGSAESLAPMRPEDLRRYMRTHYLPSTTFIVLAGAFDVGEALASVRRAFRPLMRRRGDASGWTVPAELDAPVVPEVTAARDIQQTNLALGYRTFGPMHPLRGGADMMGAILGVGMSSRLFQEVREKRGLCYAVGANLQFYSDVGMLTVDAGMDPGKAQRTLKTIDRELERIRTKKVGAEELRRTRDFLLGQFKMAFDSPMFKMRYHVSNVMRYGRIVPREEKIRELQSVTADDIRAAAQEMLRPECRAVSWVVPKGKP